MVHKTSTFGDFHTSGAFHAKDRRHHNVTPAKISFDITTSFPRRRESRPSADRAMKISLPPRPACSIHLIFQAPSHFFRVHPFEMNMRILFRIQNWGTQTSLIMLFDQVIRGISGKKDFYDASPAMLMSRSGFEHTIYNALRQPNTGAHDAAGHCIRSSSPRLPLHMCSFDKSAG